MSYILETRNLTKKYGSKAVVNEVNMHIPEGQIYGLIGRNGAGKTTIMRVISGLSSPSGGDYSLFGRTGSEREKMLREVGVLIEEPGLYPRYSAQENLKIKCIGLGIDPRVQVPALLETVGLEGVDPKKPAGSFSLGMRQRLGIALALAGNPKLLVLDEPINGLDPQGIVDVREILVRMRDEKGITILISSHILEELDKVAGGVGYSYMRKKKNGNYEIVTCSQELTVEQAKGLLNGDPPQNHGIRDDVISILPDVPADKLDAVKKQLNKAYDGCTFQTI